MSCHAYMIFAVMKIGLPPKKAGTASSIMLWVLTKLILDSGSEVESTLHRPGRGDGSLILGTERRDVETQVHQALLNTGLRKIKSSSTELKPKPFKKIREALSSF